MTLERYSRVSKFWSDLSNEAGVVAHLDESEMNTDGEIIKSIYFTSETGRVPFYTRVDRGILVGERIQGNKVTGAQSFDGMRSITVEEMENPDDNYNRLRSFLRDAAKLYKMQMCDSESHLKQAIPHGTFDETGEDVRG